MIRTSIPRWLPNAISVVRILLIPVWIWCADSCRHASHAGDMDYAQTMRLLSVAVLITIGVSDMVDGYLARHFGLTSRMGATLDAFADKLAQVSLLVFFTVRGAPAFSMTPPWFLVLILTRDVFLGLGWLALRKQRGHVRVVHRFHGKVSSALMFILLVLLTAGSPDNSITPLIWLIAAIVLLSTIAYTRDGLAQWRS